MSPGSVSPGSVSLGWTLIQAAEAVSGDLVGRSPRTVEEVATDSRQSVAGNLFVALVGESFDGHAFAADALSRGAVVVVVRQD